jgi:GNAT superfamily N-acetyltransferase
MIEIREVGAEATAQIDLVPISFRVESVLAVKQVKDGLGGLLLTEERVKQPYVKDYDSCEGEGAARWGQRFDISHWGFFLAFDGTDSVGAATVAFRSPGVSMLDGRTDLAVLWDLRVHPDRRRDGVGGRLLERVVGWARQHNCKQLQIETQNNNVPACRFYASHGCHLGAIVRYAYQEPQVAHEAMLLWYLDL